VDYFESIVKTLLERDGYWVRQSFKVGLTKEEKREVGRPSLPRPEIDLLAFKPGNQEVLALEAKSFLDSPGVNLEDLSVEHDEPTGRYKMFTCIKYRETILARLVSDLRASGLVSADASVRLGLVAGNVYGGKTSELRALMDSKGWFFWSPEDIRTRVVALASEGYENDPAIITAKLLRNSQGSRQS
jgi:hypothetical protein